MGGTALDEVVVVVDIGGAITGGALAGGEGCRVGGTSKDGVDMFVMSGGIAGDGVVGLEGEAE